MNKVTLKKVTDHNFHDVIKMSDTLTDYQKRCVAPNAISIAQAYVNQKRAWPRVIYLGKQPIGFIMIALWDDDIPVEDRPAYFLWRFMIAKDFQHKGYGKQALDLIVKKCQKDKVKTLYTSCHIEGEQPYQFYIHYGFVDTGIFDDGEEVLKMEIKDDSYHH